MDIFGNKTAKELELTKQEFDSFVKSTTNTIESLERMIEREKGTSATYQSLIKDYYRIGDPYLHNVYVRKAIDKIAGNISGVAFDIINERGDVLPENAPAQKLFRYINDEDAPTDFIYEIVRSLQRFGKAFIRSSEETIGGLPVMMDVLDASKMKAITEKGMLKWWEFDGKKKIDPDKILFIRFKHPSNPYDGLAPGSSAVKEILLDFYSSVYNIKNMQNGAQGKGVWVDPQGNALTPQQKAEAQFAVDQTFNKGVDGAGKTPVLARRLDWVRTSESNRDIEYEKLALKMRDDILIAYDIPKVLFASAETTFTNLSEAKKMFWTQTLQPIMDLIEQSFRTNFFGSRKLNYSLKFRIDEIPELQEDISTKLDSAKKLFEMNVPVSVINEVLGLGLPESGWEGWDQPPAAVPSFEFDTKPDQVKALYDDFKKQQRIEEEKQINFDDFYKHMEYEKSLRVMLQYERELSNQVKDFFNNKWKLVEDYLNRNPVKSIGEKSVADPNWIESFKNWLLQFSWGQELVDSVGGTIEKIFNRGRYRTYWGIGANFQQRPERALQHLINRGLKLQGSPDVVLESITNMLDSESFTVDELAQEISKKWKDASTARAKNISITETTAAYNGGRVEAMKELGIKKKQWVHSHDGKVRDSHRIDDIVPVDSNFELADGYTVRYPGDGDPAHACNCRCVVVSVVE